MSANEKAVKDMRNRERFDVTETIRVIDLPSGQDVGQLVNISEEGLMMHGTQLIEENSIMQLALVFGDGTGDTADICIGVESLWSHQAEDDVSYWTGFYIIDISEQDQLRIRNMAC